MARRGLIDVTGSIQRRLIRRLLAAEDGSMGERHERLAEYLGITTRTLYRWERGDSKPSQKHYDRLVSLAAEIDDDDHKEEL